MDWTRSYLQWDWETLLPPSGKDAEVSKLAQRPEWKFDGGQYNSYQNHDGSASSLNGGLCCGSEFGYGSSKSSISVSIGSTSKAGTRTPECKFKSLEQFPENITKNKDFARLDSGVLHRIAASEGPKEPLIGLKLGKRTYFEDICGETNIAMTNSSSLDPMNSSNGLVKKAKVSQQNMQSSYCQVEGCNVDLTSAKDYHRKHRVCENHSKSPRVIVAGVERRFCQQCSRFHDLSEFDQKKRSCRRRLSDHNARRRKPQPGTISFGSAIFASPYYDEREPTNLIFGQAPFSQVTDMGCSTWDNSSGFKLIPTNGSWVNSSKLGGVYGHLHLPSIGMSKNISTIRHDSDQFLPLKGTAAKVLDKGLGAPVVASYMNGASDLRRALSLLSTESWVTSDLEPVSDFQFANSNTIPSPHPANHPTNEAAAGIWEQDQLPVPLPESYPMPLNLRRNGEQFQGFQLNKTPNAALLFDSTQIH